jgi:hypothetical protein
MQFDIDVARRILLAIEATPANQYPDDVVLPDLDENAVLEHIELLIDDGMIDGKVVESSMGDDGRIYAVHLRRLTRKGHEFLANARNDQVWNKTKVFVKEKGGAVSFEILKAVLIKIAGQHFGTAP